MTSELYFRAALGMLVLSWAGNMLAWLTVWLWRKARHADERRNRKADVERDAGQRMRVVSLPDGTATLEPISTQDHPTPPKIDPRTVLVGPPMVGQYTLRDWAIHYTQRDHFWRDFTSEFYEEAAGDPLVLQVFVDAAAARDIEPLQLVTEVQQHFHRALVLLTHVGLTERLAQTLEGKHARLLLTEDVYDRTVTALVKTATRSGVPQEAMETLGQIVAELKPRMVTA